MAAGYDSPTAALAAIVDCLAVFSTAPADLVHVGSLGSGETLPCCPGTLIRVETAGLRVPDGLPRALIIVGNCKPLILDVVINYRQCFKVFSDRGAGARKVEDLTADGTALLLTWWNVLVKMACCAPLNQFVRFVSILDQPPAGNCAGWTMAIEVDVSLCGCN
jgi:hypothetical protein